MIDPYGNQLDRCGATMKFFNIYNSDHDSSYHNYKPDSGEGIGLEKREFEIHHKENDEADKASCFIPTVDNAPPSIAWAPGMEVYYKHPRSNSPYSTVKDYIISQSYVNWMDAYYLVPIMPKKGVYVPIQVNLSESAQYTHFRMDIVISISADNGNYEPFATYRTELKDPLWDFSLPTESWTFSDIRKNIVDRIGLNGYLGASNYLYSSWLADTYGPEADLQKAMDIEQILFNANSQLVNLSGVD